MKGEAADNGSDVIPVSEQETLRNMSWEGKQNPTGGHGTTTVPVRAARLNMQATMVDIEI